MTQAILTTRGSDESRQVELNPEGTTIGRSPACDIVIDSRDVSRQHACAFCDRSGRWVFEDLGSSNGLFVNGVRVEACTVGAGDEVTIGPASLSLSGPPELRTEPAVASQTPHIIVQDFGTEVFYDRPKLDECPKAPCPERLEHIRKHLSELTSLPMVYAEACRVLAWRPKTAAAVFRMSEQGRPASKMPEVLAYHFGGSPADTGVPARPEGDWPAAAFRVSHRLLDAVRLKGQPLMTKSIFSCDTQVTMSLIDEHSPRALICVQLGAYQGCVDLLYVDVLIDDRTRPGPEEMFALAQAAGRHIVQVGANLASG